MSQPYRFHPPGGVILEASGQIIYPGDPEWAEYLAWHAVQPGPDTPGGPIPPGSGLLPAKDTTPSPEAQKTEALARVDGATATQRISGTLDAIGHTWRIDGTFLLSIVVHNAAPGLPAGFTLPDVNHELVPINQGQLNLLLVAVSEYLYSVEKNQADLIAQIHTSPAPLTLPIGPGS